MSETTLRLEVRRQLRPLIKTKKRWAVCVAHRRCGKTVAAVQRLILSALACDKPRPRCAYIAPTYSQAKAVAWDYLKAFTRGIATATHESELRVTLPNEGQVRLYGAENYDALRGIYLDDVVLDEFADMSPEAWTVIRPTLSDRGGRALFIGTPKGRNEFWRIYDAATRDEAWLTLALRADETGLLAPEELEDARKALTPEQFEQEYLCSFDAAILGSYYGRLLDDAQREGRIAQVPYDPAVRVETWWDLGVGDSTAIWFVQHVHHEIRVIDHYEMTGEGLAHYAKVLERKPYVYSRHIAPHDISVRELGSGKSRLEMARELGIRFEIAPKLSVDDGINAVRMALPRCWFDAQRCARGIEFLRLYRTDYDEKLKVFRSKPRHDFTSHTADAFRYGCVARSERAQMKEIAMPQFASPMAWAG
jgi:phage terminase large subunit